ncbi:hypothetical protein PDESU_04991 [Pontiella desulfatans]|uniref:Beta-glucanase n=1 Tax=Pontiella desulfatans TaxID=2750659 RepID=A0A6C2U8L4_PONDE|nr:glycoside hydrolase family 43 protein [Pontiella desulfatans]VGO16400.1 hypothetical protein PDESU_04991 [Pontiella desulfatans]
MNYKYFTPGSIWNDTDGTPINAHGGGLLFHDDTYYWYGEHKIEGTAGNVAMVGVHCYSSPDLYNWTDEGIALTVSDDEHSEIARGCILERPKVIFNAKTGKFVMWFHLERKGEGYSTARSGVAVADSPAGPFTFKHSLRPNAGHWPVNVTEDQKDPESIAAAQARDQEFIGEQTHLHQHYNLLGSHYEGGQMARDMNLFVDDDSKAYHVYASEHNATLHIAELTDDYTGHTGNYVRLFPTRFMEAPALFKRKGKYFLLASGCTGWAPNAARSALAADTLLGLWTELENPCHGTNPQNNLGPEKTFGAQSTYVLHIHGKEDAYIALFDIWCPENAIDGRYVWLPLTFDDETRYSIHWHDQWDLSLFDAG